MNTEKQLPLAFDELFPIAVLFECVITVVVFRVFPGMCSCYAEHKYSSNGRHL